MENGTEKRWKELKQTTERSPNAETRAVTALRGIAVEYGQCETVADYKAATKALNDHLVPLAQSIATPAEQGRGAA